MDRCRVVLVRHGESEWNLLGRWQGHGGPGLSGRGHRQAERTAEFLATAEPEVTAIVASDLQRVVETAAYTAERLGLDVTYAKAWREINVGWWTGMTHDEIVVADREGFEAWRRGEDLPVGGGESPGDLRARVADALADVAATHEAGTVLVFTHGGPVRAAAAHALGLAPGPDRRLAGAHNASLSVLAARDGDWRLVGYNATGHLGGT